MKTIEDVELLISEWVADPMWDLSETEGFEDHKRFLSEIEDLWHKRWRWQEEERIRQRSVELNCSVELATYVLSLERQMDALKGRLIKIENDGPWWAT